MEKILNVVDAVTQHGQAVNAHAEGKAADFFGVVVDEAIDGRIDHAGAEEFDPARALAFGANASARGGASPTTENAGHVEFDGRLGKREKAGAETRFDTDAEELLH